MDVHEVIDLRAVLQAEQVVILLLDRREWAKGGGIRWHAPGLAGAARWIAERDDDDDDNDGCRKEDGDDSREEGGGGSWTSIAPLGRPSRSSAPVQTSWTRI